MEMVLVLLPHDLLYNVHFASSNLFEYVIQIPVDPNDVFLQVESQVYLEGNAKN
jgi:hypothetical protein